MPRRKLPPKLVLKKQKTGNKYWYIRYEHREHATGYSEQETAGAQEKLQLFLNELRDRDKATNSSSEIFLADVLQKYAQDKYNIVHQPDRMILRIERLNAFFGALPLVGGATGDKCREFVNGRGQVAARRELEILRAAVNHWLKETGQQKGSFSIWMPPNPRPRDDYFQRDEAARMLSTIYRARESQSGLNTSRKTQLHLARFFLIGLYTGTRSGALLKLRWSPSPDNGWIDLEQGTLYREGRREMRNNKRQPPVKIPPKLLSHLKRWNKMDNNPFGYVINFGGIPIKSIKTAWNTSRQKANISKSYTPHTLRHTRATWMLQKGVPLWEAASSLGMTVQQLERTYGHHSPDFQLAAAKAF